MKASAALAVLASACLLVSSASATTRGRSEVRYTVAFTTTSIPAGADQLVGAAGGRIVDRLTQLGAVSVVSSDPAFASKMDKLANVAAADPALKTSVLLSAPGSVSSVLGAKHAQGGASSRRQNDGGSFGKDPQPMPDPLGQLQWDKMRMDVSTKGSYRVNRGRSDVLVAFTDTGVDTSHPDISANLDLADSRSFITAPAPSDPAYTLPEDYVGVQDYNGHGTWVASAVAAPINGIGISGVAPGVTIVALKTQDATGNGWLSDWADAVRYAANIGVDVVSSSIYTYVPTCGGLTPSDCAGADSDYIVAQRAVDYARARGTLVIAALGNENRDVSNTSSVHDLVRDYYGVDFPGPWITAPGGLNGVVGVSATGYFNQKAVYSNYGLGVADIAAPGGDTDFQDPGTYPGGGTLIGAWTSTDVFGRSVETNCSHNDKVCAPYAFEEGTSMATPNVAGVAALIISQYGSFGGQQGGNGRSDNNGKRGGDGETGRNRPQIHLSPDRVEQILLGSAVQQSCPTPSTVTYFSEPFPGWPAGVPFLYDTATCGGSSGNNGFYGAGIANALAALTGNLRR